MPKTTITGRGRKAGFTLIELLVVMAVVSAVMAILLPALSKARRQARLVLNKANEGQIANAVNCFAFDNDESYPDSVATIGTLDRFWHWQEPMVLTGTTARSPQEFRSTSAYLQSYIQDSRTMFCPNAPRKYKYLQQSWEAGEDWDNPETPMETDEVYGTYCFYWNYTGCLEEGEKVFRGPRDPSAGGRSKLLVSDYFGYGYWRLRERYGTYKAYGSCERFKDASVTPGTEASSDLWSCREEELQFDTGSAEVMLYAAYVDGHVESYPASEAAPMRVSRSPDGRKPFPLGVGGGDIYLPQNALR